MKDIKIPEYTILSEDNKGGVCYECGRKIKNVYVIRNNKTKEINEYGSGCAKKVMGISVAKCYKENKDFEEQENHKKTIHIHL